MDNDQNLSRLAMSIFYTKNISILEAIAESNMVEMFSKKILSNADMNDEISYRQVSRLAEIAELCISTLPEYIESFSFVTKLLKYCDNDIVTLSILNLLENDEELITIHLFFETSSFVSKIIKNIQDLKASNVHGYRLSNLYKILLKCLKNEQLSKECLTPSVLKVVGDFDENDEACVLKQQWELIFEISLMSNFLFDASEYDSICEKALLAIEPKSDSFYYEYQVFALDFIMNAIKDQRMSQGGFGANLKKILKPIDTHFNISYPPLCNLIKRIFKQYPNHTLALTSAVDAVIVLFNVNSSEKQAFNAIYSTFIPFFLNIVTDMKDENKILRIFAINAIKKVVNLGEINDVVSDKIENDDNFVGICNSTIYEFEKLKMKSYGGFHKKYDKIKLQGVPSLKIPQTVD